MTREEPYYSTSSTGVCTTTSVEQNHPLPPAHPAVGPKASTVRMKKGHNRGAAENLQARYDSFIYYQRDWDASPLTPSVLDTMLPQPSARVAGVVVG